MYSSKIVGVGEHLGNPLVFYGLVSRSKPYRELRLNLEKRRVNVFPKLGYENHPTNTDPEVDNYACIKAGRLGEDLFLTTFNGHMTKRTHQNLVDGLNPFIALDLTLLEFRGLPGDSRIGGIAYSPKPREKSDPEYKSNSYWLGVHDMKRKEKRISAYPNNRQTSLENKVVFVCNQDTEFEKTLALPTKELTPEELAKYIHQNILGGDLLFNLSTAVGLVKQRSFEFGVYNQPVSEEDLEKWALKYISGGAHLLLT